MTDIIINPGGVTQTILGTQGPRGAQGPTNVINFLEDGGRFGGTPEPQGAELSGYSAPSYITANNSAVITSGAKFINDNNDYGGSGGVLDSNVKALIDKIKNINYRRYGVEFYLLDIVAGAGTSNSYDFNGITHYLPFKFIETSLPFKFSFNCHVFVNSGSIGIALGSQNQVYFDGTQITEDSTLSNTDGWVQISKLFDIDPRYSVGYDCDFHDIYVTPLSHIYIAIPVICPGSINIEPGYYYNTVPSLRSWK